MTWLDRVDEQAVWIDAAGVERLVPVDARAPPEGAVMVDGHASPECATRVRTYVHALRARRAALE